MRVVFFVFLFVSVVGCKKGDGEICRLATSKFGQGQPEAQVRCELSLREVRSKLGEDAVQNRAACITESESQLSLAECLRDVVKNEQAQGHWTRESNSPHL